MTVKRQSKEKMVEDELVRRVTAARGVIVKTRAIGQRGFFDRIVILPGPRVIFVECKRPAGGRVAVHQIRYMQLFRNLGVEVALIKNQEDIDRLMTAP